MAVEYRKSSLASLFEQLPTLILGYMAQKQKMAQDDRRFERRFQQERELLGIRLDKQANASDMQYLLGKRDTLSEDVEESLHELTLKYPGIKPEDHTAGADKIIDDAVRIENDKVASLGEQIRGFKLKDRALDALESNLVSEISGFRTGYGPHAGESGVLNPAEFEQYKATLGQDAQFITSYPHTIKTNYQDSLSVVNKNPLNVTDFNTGDFQVFNTHQEGWKAGFAQVDREYERNDTLEQLIKGGNLNAITADRPEDGGWSADPEEIQDSYVNYLAQYTGASKDTPIQNIDKDLLVEGMAKFEGYLDKDQFAPSEFDLTQSYGMDSKQLELQQLAFDVGYQMMGDRSQMWALERQTIDNLKLPLETAGSRAYSVIQGLFKIDEEKGIDTMEDLAESLAYKDPETGDLKIPSIDAVNTAANMLGQPDYDKFLNSIYAYETLPLASEGQKKSAAEVRELFMNAPGINLNFRNMEDDYLIERRLESEKAGHPLVQSSEDRIAIFKDDLSKIDSENVDSVFDQYYRSVANVPQEEHPEFWSVLEDLYKDTDVNLEDEFNRYWKTNNASGDSGSPSTIKPKKEEKPAEKMEVFTKDTYKTAKSNLLKSIDEWNKFHYDDRYASEKSLDYYRGESELTMYDEYGEQWTNPQRDEEYAAAYNERWEEFQSHANTYFDIMDAEKHYGDYEIEGGIFYPEIERQSKITNAAKLRENVAAKYPDLMEKLRSLQINPETGEIDFEFDYTWDHGEIWTGRPADPRRAIDRRFTLLPGMGRYETKHLLASNAYKGGQVHPLTPDGESRRALDEGRLSTNEYTEKYGHPGDVKQALGEKVMEALDVLHLLEKEGEKTTLFGHEDILLGFDSRGIDPAYRVGISTHLMSRKDAPYGHSFIPMGDYFDEVTEDWPEWKKQKYVDDLEEHLFTLLKRNPKYGEGLSQGAYLGKEYDVRPELDILDVFDK